MFDLDLIDNIEWSDIDYSDYPDFCDAYISSADYKGKPMTESELDDLNDNYPDFLYEQLWKHIM